MNPKRRKAYLRICFSVLLFLFSLAGCSPGPIVYEGPLEAKTSITLKEGKEYFVCFENKKAYSILPVGSSGGAGGGNWPTLNKIIVLHDEKGNTIPNMITNKIDSWGWGGFGFGRTGITVARFRLEGKDSRSIEVSVNWIAYRAFATKFNKRRRAQYDETFAPLKPDTITIRDPGKFSLGTWLVIATLLIVLIVFLFIWIFGKTVGTQNSQVV